MTKTANKNEAELLELVSLNTGVEKFNETELIWKKNEKDDYRDVNLSSKNGDLITIREYDSGNHKIFHKPPSGPLETHRIIRAGKKPEDQEKPADEVRQPTLVKPNMPAEYVTNINNFRELLSTDNADVKFNGMSGEGKFNSTSYDFTVNGKKVSFSTLDGERFNVWANYGQGKGAQFTQDSFKADELTKEDKLSLDGIHNNKNPGKAKEVEQQPQKRQPNQSIYNISFDHIKSIQADGRNSTKWAKYNGDKHEIFEALAWSAKEAKIEPNDLAKIVEHESGFNPYAKSKTGAMGLGQFTSPTWNDMAYVNTVSRNGEKFKGLARAYPELDWGSRTGIVENALATAFYTKRNMDAKGTDDINIGYLAHNIGPTGSRKFLAELKSDPDCLCFERSQIINNPANFTKMSNGKRVPLTHGEALTNIDRILDKSLESAMSRGYQPISLAELEGQKSQERQPVARSRNDGYNPNKSYFAVNVKEDPDMKGLNANAQEAFNQAAFDFKQRTGDSVIVTSGFRGPYRQARTMYDQYFTQGKGADQMRTLYNSKAAVPNVEAFKLYDQMKGSYSRSEIIAKMTDLYQDFADKGIYATGHMRGDKVDISVSNLSSSERSTWEDVMKDHGISSRYHDRHYDITLPKSPSTREHQLAKNSGTETPLQEKAEKAFPGQEVRISGKNIYLNGNVETASGTFLPNGDIWTRDKVIRNKDLSSNDLQISESDMHHIATTMKNGGITQETQVESISAEQAALLANNSGIELKQDQAQPGELGLQSQQLADLSNLESQQGIS